MYLEKVSSMIELSNGRANKVACVLREASDEPGHLPSLIRVFIVNWQRD